MALVILLACAGLPFSRPAFAQAPFSGAEWARRAEPTPGPTRIIGGTSLGCIAGAVALPPEGPGWQAVRLFRNRHWGSPDLVRHLQTLATQARAAGFPALWIGDMSQPRGGPLPFGHASHQTGIDADIWLDLRQDRGAIGDADPPSLVLADQSAVDPSRFTERHAGLIRLAASQPGVDRVLVNHGIKRSLCQMHGGEAWLRRVRPWRGHDSHMHIRLRCPPGQPDCQDLPPPPAGDGCDASLAWWLGEEARRPIPRPPGPPPVMPQACAAVFNAP